MADREALSRGFYQCIGCNHVYIYDMVGHSHERHRADSPRPHSMPPPVNIYPTSIVARSGMVCGITTGENTNQVIARIEICCRSVSLETSSNLLQARERQKQVHQNCYGTANRGTSSRLDYLRDNRQVQCCRLRRRPSRPGICAGQGYDKGGFQLSAYVNSTSQRRPFQSPSLT